MKAGPKPQASNHPLPERDMPPAGADRVVAWVQRWCKAPKGAGAGEPMVVRPWQRRLLAVFDSPRPRLALWSLPRGSGKTSLAAAVSLYALHSDGVEGARVVMVASDERQARLCFHTATRMVETSEPLSKRTTPYHDRLVVPRTGSELAVLPAERHRLEGLDVSFAVVDEVGFVRRDMWETILHSTGKRPEGSQVLAIGTPSPPGWRDVSPMWDLVCHGRDHPGDPDLALIEYGAPPDAQIDDPDVWEAACPGLGDLVTVDTMRALAPPRTREPEYRRARLGTWLESDHEAWIPRPEWEACAAPGPIPDGDEVVVSLDGSFSQDATVLVVASIAPTPHVDLVRIWQPGPGDSSYRVPVLEVEDAVRDACRRWSVREIICDPFRWRRSMEVLEADRLPVVEFPQSAGRMTPATTGFREAVINRQLTHSADPDLTRHVLAAAVREDSRGVRLHKPPGPSLRRIDAAVAAVMAHARATHYARKRKPSRLLVLR